MVLKGQSTLKPHPVRLPDGTSPSVLAVQLPMYKFLSPRKCEVRHNLDEESFISLATLTRSLALPVGNMNTSSNHGTLILCLVATITCNDIDVTVHGANREAQPRL